MRKKGIIIRVIILAVISLPFITAFILFISAMSVLKLILQEAFILIGFIYWPFKFYREYYRRKIKKLRYDSIADRVRFDSSYIYDKQAKKYIRIQK
ncbi:MAG: hypothetical protein JXB49_30040 [Bacteroidales bacterium]|nr:hypothetical protein [Bacteroidales bacterium]